MLHYYTRIRSGLQFISTDSKSYKNSCKQKGDISLLHAVCENIRRQSCSLDFSFRYNGNLIIVFFKSGGRRILFDKNDIAIGILNDVGILQMSG